MRCYGNKKENEIKLFFKLKIAVFMISASKAVYGLSSFVFVLTPVCSFCLFLVFSMKKRVWTCLLCVYIYHFFCDRTQQIHQMDATRWHQSVVFLLWNVQLKLESIGWVGAISSASFLVKLRYKPHGNFRRDILYHGPIP